MNALNAWHALLTLPPIRALAAVLARAALSSGHARGAASAIAAAVSLETDAAGRSVVASGTLIAGHPGDAVAGLTALETIRASEATRTARTSTTSTTSITRRTLAASRPVEALGTGDPIDPIVPVGTGKAVLAAGPGLAVSAVSTGHTGKAWPSEPAILAR